MDLLLSPMWIRDRGAKFRVAMASGILLPAHQGAAGRNRRAVQPAPSRGPVNRRYDANRLFVPMVSSTGVFLSMMLESDATFCMLVAKSTNWPHARRPAFSSIFISTQKLGFSLFCAAVMSLITDCSLTSTVFHQSFTALSESPIALLRFTRLLTLALSANSAVTCLSSSANCA